jgi:hypothetical protein
MLRRSTTGQFDQRYVYCERPTVITGGELSLSMLDLNYNPVARTYTGAAAIEGVRRRVHRGRPWPPGGTAAGADQPLDRAARR